MLCSLRFLARKFIILLNFPAKINLFRLTQLTKRIHNSPNTNISKLVSPNSPNFNILKFVPTYFQILKPAHLMKTMYIQMPNNRSLDYRIVGPRIKTKTKSQSFSTTQQIQMSRPRVISDKMKIVKRF